MKIRLIVLCISFSSLIIGCISSSYELSEIDCIFSESDQGFSALSSYQSHHPVQIREAVSVEGYIISSSAEGQFYGELILQDTNESPSIGLRILTDASHIETLYPRGSFVRFHLQGYYVQFRNNTYTLGEAFPSFGNIIIGRIPTIRLKNSLNRLCDALPLNPKQSTIQELTLRPLNTWVQFDSIRFHKGDSLMTFSSLNEDTTQMLVDCVGDSIGLKISRYASFASELIPNKMGSIQAVYKKNASGTYLEIEKREDINFNLEACQPPPLFVSSNQVLISEWADPSNNSKARFIELYNSSDQEISLNGWKLIRYTNANTDPGTQLVLDELVIGSKQVVVIASNVEEFTSAFGFEADLYASTSSVAASNGDDQAVLIDPFGAIIDVFGIIGEDGTGTSHDFEDGKAIRKSEITQASSVFDPSGWIIYNKRGEAGTIQQSLIAPQDYSPGIHPD